MPSFNESDSGQARYARTEPAWSVVCYRQYDEERKAETITEHLIQIAEKLYALLDYERWDIRAFPARPGMKLQTIDALIANPRRSLIYTFNVLSGKEAEELGKKLEGIYRATSLQHARVLLKKRQKQGTSC